MLYKTIILQLLEQRPDYHKLRKKRMLLPVVELYSRQLKTSHEAWKSRLLPARPDSDPSQIASEALEIALKEMEYRLPSGWPEDRELLSLEKAMAFIRRHTPPE